MISSGRWSSFENVGVTLVSIMRSGSILVSIWRSTNARSLILWVPFYMRVAVVINWVRARVSAVLFRFNSNELMGEWFGALTGSQQLPALQSPITVTRSGEYF